MSLPVKKRDAKKRLWFVGKLLLSAVYIVYVLRVTDVSLLAQTIASASWGWYFLGFVFWMVSQASNALRWFVLSKPLGLPTRWSRYMSLYFIGAFFNTFLPTLIGGDVVKAYYLTKGTGRRAHAATSVIMDRNVGVGGLLLVGCLASLFNPVSIEGKSLFPVLSLMLLAYLLLNLIILTPVFHHRTVAVLNRLSLTFVAEKFSNLFDSLGVYRGHLKRLVLLAVLSSGIHAVSYVAIYFIGVSIGAELPLYYYLVFVPIVAIVTMLPISIGGLGLRETAFLTLFTAVGLSPEQSVGLSVLWYAMLLLGGVPGLILYLGKKK